MKARALLRLALVLLPLLVACESPTAPEALGLQPVPPTSPPPVVVDPEVFDTGRQLWGHR